MGSGRGVPRWSSGKSWLLNCSRGKVYRNNRNLSVRYPSVPDAATGTGSAAGEAVAAATPGLSI